MTNKSVHGGDPGLPFIEIIERSVKPRKIGLTLVHDPGFGPLMVRAHLETAAPYIDYAKMRNVTPRLFPERVLFEKVALYREYEIEMLFGGIIFEMAYLQGHIPEAIAYAKKAGVTAVEISENVITLPLKEKLDFVRRYRDSGVNVFYELGKKFPTEPLDANRVAEEIHELLEAGVFKVILEQAELAVLFGSENGLNILKQLMNAVDLEHIIFETGNSQEEVWLINALGPDVNLGPNIKLDQVIWLEPTRRGLGRTSGYTALSKYIHP